MTRFEKNNLYDRVCHVLTDYEENTASKYDLYDVLADIACAWEEITGDDSD